MWLLLFCNVGLDFALLSTWFFPWRWLCSYSKGFYEHLTFTSLGKYSDASVFGSRQGNSNPHKDPVGLSCVGCTAEPLHNSNIKCWFPCRTEPQLHMWVRRWLLTSTWHNAGQSNCPLTNEFPPERIVIPNIEPHQGDLWPVNAENQGLLPKWIKTWNISERKVTASRMVVHWDANSNKNIIHTPLSSTTLVCCLQQSPGKPIISTST